MFILKLIGIFTVVLTVAANSYMWELIGGVNVDIWWHLPLLAFTVLTCLLGFLVTSWGVISISD